MGFDPRTASRAGSPAGEAPAHGAAPAPAPEDTFDELDFSIDLEKELLGDFADDVAPRAAAPVDDWNTPAPQVAPAEDRFEAAYEQDRFAPEAPQAAADDFSAQGYSAPQDYASPSDAGWLDDVSANAAASDYDDLDAEMERAFELAPIEAEEPRALPLAANDIPEPVVQHEPSFDDDAFAGLDFTVEDTASVAADLPPQVEVRDIGDHTSEFYSAGPLEFEPVADEPVNMDRAFDAALADVDLTFDEADDRSAEPYAASAAQGDLDRELALSLDDGFAATLQAEEPSPAVAEAEMSLEDELNALLGNSSASRSAPAVNAGLAAAPVSYAAPVAAAPASVPVASNQVGPVTSDWDAAPSRDDATNFAPQPSISYGYEAGYDASARDQGEPDFHLDFDDAEFDEALSHSAGPERVEAPAPQPVAASAAPQEDAQPASDTVNPYAALAALSATLKPSRSFATEAPREAPVSQQPQMHVPVQDYAQSFVDDGRGQQPIEASSDAYVPDIDTYDVPEQAVALADDLDLPEFAYEDEPTPQPAYDDLDSEFTSLLNGMNSADIPAPVAAAAAPREERIDLSRPGENRTGPAVFAGVPYPAPSAQPAAPQVRPAEPAWNASSTGQDADDVYSDMRPSQPASRNADPELADMEFAYDPDLEEDIALPAYAPIEQKKSPRRGMMIAAVVGGVAVLGGVGALALSWGGGTGATGPVLVKADDQPVKVKPENPGGTTIPNQDNKVYDTVAGGSAPVDPKQDTLVSSEEEPVDIPPPVDETADMAGDEATADAAAVPPSQKAEDRIEQSAEEPGVDKSMEVAAVAPRKVRTMIVKADGTLVAREDPAPAPPAEDATAVMTAPAPTAAPTSTGTVDAAEQPTELASAPAAEETLPIANAPAEEPALAPASKPAEEAAAPADPQPQAEPSSVTPQKVPVAPARPADQPVNVVGEVKADKVAALSPAAAAPAGAWAMQIASQPTEEAAKASYQDLARRYGSVLQGRQVNVVKAEIAGKGTFWRVRVAASSRNEAVGLCESYKAAGGNCFVSK